jgi:NADPH-dependent 2,4-dienoyl-CoA reductase/sulfur reductase-like enzyme
MTPSDLSGHQAEAFLAPAPRLPMALAIASGVAGFALAAYFNLLG